MNKLDIEKQLEKKIKTLEFELEDCRADLEEIRAEYYGEEGDLN